MLTILFFLVILIINLFFIYLAWRLGKLYLAAALILNIILTIIFAGQIVELFGTLIGLSALFYAPIFVITNIINEYHGKKEARKIMHIGLFSLVALLSLLYLSINLSPSGETAEMTSALNTLFTVSVRTVFGTILTYYIAQMVTIYLYRKIGDLTKGGLLWLRHNAAIIIALGIDSIIFYPIAFYGTISMKALLTVIVTGWIIKSTVSLTATPIVYLIRKNQ